MSTVISRQARRTGIAAVSIASILGGVVIASTNVSAVSDVSSYSTVSDARGANDVSGQKDLTQQGFDNSTTGVTKVFWNWDDTSISGKNTLDGCVLFDSDGDGRANAAMCATVDSRSLKSFTLYTCGDSRNDRCDSPVTPVTISDTATTKCYGLDRTAVGPFDSADTRVFCDVKHSEIAASGVGMLNTCSYSSAQPTSDPADCVLVPGRIPTTLTGSNTLIPNASVSLGGWTSGGSTSGTDNDVLFELFATSDCSGTALYTQSFDVTAAGTQSTTNTGSGAGMYTIDTAGTYKWRIRYYGNDVNLPSLVSCGTVSATLSALSAAS